MKIEANSRHVHVKDRVQVAICEPVEVDDDGDIFGRKRINGTDRIFVRQILLASQASLACIARLEPRLDELQYIINIQCQPYCTFVCFNCLLINILYVTIRLCLPYTPSTTQFERTPYSISSHLLDLGLSK